MREILLSSSPWIKHRGNKWVSQNSEEGTSFFRNAMHFENSDWLFPFLFGGWVPGIKTKGTLLLSYSQPPFYFWDGAPISCSGWTWTCNSLSLPFGGAGTKSVHHYAWILFTLFLGECEVFHILTSYYS